MGKQKDHTWGKSEQGDHIWGNEWIGRSCMGKWVERGIINGEMGGQGDYKWGNGRTGGI